MPYNHFLKNLNVTDSNTFDFINISNQIIEGKKTAQDTSHLKHQIDVMVYHLYGLSYEEACVIDAEDVQEVENWYARRYPKLSGAQKANLRALGKSDDYLELYGLK